MEDEEKKTTRARPIRPFLTGLAIAAGWGAIDMPPDVTVGSLGAFAARMAAIALVAGGGVAMGIEAVRFALRRGRTRFRA